MLGASYMCKPQDRARAIRSSFTVRVSVTCRFETTITFRLEPNMGHFSLFHLFPYTMPVLLRLMSRFSHFKAVFFLYLIEIVQDFVEKRYKCI